MKLERKKIYGGVLLGLLLFWPGKVLAHVFPDHSEPRVGSEITVAPRMIKIWFDGQLEPFFSTVHVMDASGKEISLKDSRVDDRDPSVLEVSVPPLSPGKYEVDWKALAKDGHLTEGRFLFTVKEERKP
ncbi:MAG TPA: copper resistance CopC family protein [Nitrospiria bacterium]|nr:copper resistance CopC family protein [Nitrospiria bacterium]